MKARNSKWRKVGERAFAVHDHAVRAADGLHFAGYRVRCLAPTRRRTDWLVRWFEGGKK